MRLRRESTSSAANAALYFPGAAGADENLLVMERPGERGGASKATRKSDFSKKLRQDIYL